MANKAPSKKQAAASKVAKQRSEAQREAAVRDMPVTGASSWKKQREAGKLQVPSGNVCLVHVAGMESFISRGIVPNALMPIVTRAVKDGKGIGEDEAKAMVSPENIVDMMQFSDNVVCDVVIEPKVNSVAERKAILADESLSPDEKAKRINSMLFVDEVDLADKMFIFQYVVGGTRDLETFRQQSTIAVANLAAVEAVPAKAK